jgi:uncharacterized protein YbcI
LNDAPETPPNGEGGEQDGQSTLAMLSREMVRIYKEQFGRGPTRAHSHFVGPDAVICILENTFTPAERNLQALGEHQRLRDMRIFLQYAASEEFTDAVRRATGRRVLSFISGVDTSTDTACELFTLEREVSRAAAGEDAESPRP